MTTVFFSYSHKDEDLRDELEIHLAQLRHDGLITGWHDRRIIAGDNLDASISERLESADVILLLVSPDFIASNYCYTREMTRALERHSRGEAHVIPVILRHCEWLRSPLAKLKAAPKDGKPVKAWLDRDEALADVTREVRAAVERIQAHKPSGRLEATARAASLPLQPTGIPPAAGTPSVQGPRSSNLRLKKEFTEKDQDDFMRQSFDFICRFFEASVAELQERHSEVEGNVERIDTRTLVAVLYRNGKTIAQCSLRLDGGMGHRGSSILYSNDASTRGSGSFNEQLHVSVTEQSLFLTALGMAVFGGSGDRNKQMTQEYGAEVLWDLFISQAQR